MRKICAMCEQNMSSKQLKIYELDLTVGTINIWQDTNIDNIVPIVHFASKCACL